MIRIMLVDDEPFIRVAIKSLFPWEKYGFSITAEANNAKEALHKLDLENIDLLITDIKMPVMDGIALIHQVKARYPHIHCVVLSNYGDFDLTRRAFIEGAVDYLLKGSLNEDSFSALVQRLRANCFKVPSSMPEEAAEAVPSHEFEDKVTALQHLISSRPGTQLDLTAAQTLDFGLPFVICSLKLLPRNMRTTLPERPAQAELFKNTVYKIIAEISEFKLHYYAVTTHEYVLIIYCQDSDEQIFFRRLKAFFKKLDSNIEIYLNSFSVVGISQMRKNLSDILFAYEEADALSSRIFYCSQSAQYYYTKETDLFCGKNDVKKYALSCIDSIPLLIREQNWDALYKLFSGLIVLMCQNTYPPLQGKRLVSNLEFLMLSEISRRFEDNPGFFVDNEVIYDSIMQAVHIQRLEQAVKDFFENIKEASSSLSLFSSECSDIVKQAVLCLKERYRNPETNLSVVAEAISVNPSYLSRLFHKETGKTFNSYLTFLRLEYAKNLLQLSQDSVSDIAEKCGYNNSKYFINLFKKTMGESPSAYRNRQKNKSPQ